MNNIHIDIVSDIACPWCAIGYARLEQAMQQLEADYSFTVQWRAFELNPNQGSKAQPLFPGLALKYGKSEAEMRETQSHMMVIAKELGLNFDQLQERMSCNTFAAHRLVIWAAEHGQQTAMKKSLFDAYFGRGLDMSDHGILLDCVDVVGLDRTQAKQVLESDQYAAAVREDEAVYQQAGVSSVPAYVINKQYLISGAQEAATLVEAFKEISAAA